MIYSLRILALCFAVLCAAFPAAAQSPLLQGIVSEVRCGDTFALTLASGETIEIHLSGIDAPKREKRESNTGRVKRPGQPFGEESYQALKGKLERRRVTVELVGKSKSGKPQGIVIMDTRDLGREMVLMGLAWAHHCSSVVGNVTDYAKDEEQARKGRRGLWKQDHPQPPWEFLKQWKMKEALLVGWL